MKKILALTLAVVMCLALFTACGKKAESGTDTSAGTDSSTGTNAAAGSVYWLNFKPANGLSYFSASSS